MDEREFQSVIQGLLAYAGYDLVYHVIDKRHPARVTSRGFPDLVASHPARGIIIAEVKTDAGDLRLGQMQWLIRLRQIAPAHVWRPRWLDIIEAQIAGDTPVCPCEVCRGERPLAEMRERRGVDPHLDRALAARVIGDNPYG